MMMDSRLEQAGAMRLGAERMPSNTRFVNHLGLKPILGTVVDRLSLFGGVQAVGIIGRNGSGKSTVASEISAVMNMLAKKQNMEEIEFVSVPFASCIEFCRRFNMVDANTPNGSFTADEYEIISQVQTGFVLAEMNYFKKKPKVVKFEVTGLTGFINQDGIMEGEDRGQSTLRMVAAHPNSSGIVVNRPSNLVEPFSKGRALIEQASPEEFPDILDTLNVGIAQGGRLINLHDSSIDDLAIYLDEYKKGASRAKGMIEANLKADLLRRDLYERGIIPADEEIPFIEALMDNANKEFRYNVVHNTEVRKSGIVIMHRDIREEEDVVKRALKAA